MRSNDRFPHPGQSIVEAVLEAAFGASSPIRRVISHRLQGADSGPSPDDGQPSQVDPKPPFAQHLRQWTFEVLAARERDAFSAMKQPVRLLAGSRAVPVDGIHAVPARWDSVARQLRHSVPRKC
jgi:hypothetical protein